MKSTSLEMLFFYREFEILVRSHLKKVTYLLKESQTTYRNWN